MTEFFSSSSFLALLVTIGSFVAVNSLKKKVKFALFNPILISSAVSILFLVLTKTDYQEYRVKTEFLSRLLTPATVCLAIPLYEQFEVLKKKSGAIFAGILSGVLSSFICMAVLALLFKLDHSMYVTILPKSVTSAIGMELSALNGGNPSITTVLIILSGITGNITAVPLLKLLRVTDPVAKGVATGTSSHAIGTAKAMEMGETEGAVSSLSIVIAGIMTVIEMLFVSRIF
ncbi:MAG: LrgB family protein [Sphaerochaetaceae bacterium]|nr:LrgB family protein [Sphaerochaetaceae bacterium]